MEKLGKVQRRAAQIIQKVKVFSYEETVKKCGLTTLTTLEKRRSRGNSIKAEKIITGMEAQDSDKGSLNYMGLVG